MGFRSEITGNREEDVGPESAFLEVSTLKQ